MTAIGLSLYRFLPKLSVLSHIERSKILLSWLNTARKCAHHENNKKIVAPLSQLGHVILFIVSAAN